MKLEKLEYPEKSVVKMTFSATAEELEAGAQAVYEHTRDSYTIKGFEKGQADRAAIEAERGEHVFWYDAINDIMDRDVGGLIDAAVAENSLTTMGEPNYDLVSVKKDEGFVATATIALKPELTLGAYTGLTAEAVPAAVTEKEIDRQIESKRSANAELVSHKGPAVKGNIAVLDYKGTVDGVAFEGGEAKDQKLTLGQGRMIPGFEEGILGHAAGEEFDLEVTFPANYGKKDLAGKKAVFHIVLHDVCVRQLPALNSDFAKKVANLDSMEALRAQIREQMETARRNTALGRARNELIGKAGEAAEGELPSLLIEEEYNSEMRQFQFQLQMMRASLAQYLQQTRQSKDEFFAAVRRGAERTLRTRLALDLIAAKEGLVPTAEELESEIAARAERAKKPLEEFREKQDLKAVSQAMARRRAQDFIIEHSTIEEKEPQAPAKA
jgi:trigger factor